MGLAARDTADLGGSVQEPVVPFAFLRVKPIGLMQMIDQGEQVGNMGEQLCSFWPGCLYPSLTLLDVHAG